MSTKIPPLLEPYLSLPPEASLILLTNVLGASSNWLLLRFLHSTLLGTSDAYDENEEPKVVLVSFMRDFAFWKENAKRLVYFPAFSFAKHTDFFKELNRKSHGNVN